MIEGKPTSKEEAGRGHFKTRNQGGRALKKGIRDPGLENSQAESKEVTTPGE